MITYYYNVHTHSPSLHSDEVSILNRIIRGKKEEKEKSKEKTGFLSAGIHPWYIEDVAVQMKQLRDVATLPEVVAIGEAGLDRLTDTPIDIQQDIFARQAHLAEALQKPFIIHCVKAWEELMAVKKQIKPKTAWIIHGFRGKPDMAEQLVHQDFHLSFGAHFNPGSLPIAYPNHILTETDDKDCSIQMVYRQIASALHITEEVLGKQIQKNVKSLFPI
ncbi:MAG: TatD family hydrolase [Tannerellaceae bacterium]|jgi:TatD DNase family protein|nr:TatD family hydrolase [Tannerellaceae bacterium]